MSKSNLRLVFCLFLLSSAAKAQDTMVTHDSKFRLDQHVYWVDEFPSVEKGSNSKSGKKVVNFIFGKGEENILVKPIAIVAYDTNNYWILDQGIGSVVHAMDLVGDLTHFKGKNNPLLNSLVGICLLPDGKLLLTDSYLCNVFTLVPEKRELGIFSDSITLNRPTGIAYSTLNQQVWLVETNAHRLAIFDQYGNFIRHIGGRGTGPGEFNFPTSIWIDEFGKVFIVDAMNFRIQIFSADGEFIHEFGKIGDATGYFARPKGISTDSDGNIYVVDALFNTVQIFSPEGKFMYNFGTQGRGPGEFWMPAGIFIDQQDYIYVADMYNSRIQIFKYQKGGAK